MLTLSVPSSSDLLGRHSDLFASRSFTVCPWCHSWACLVRVAARAYLTSAGGSSPHTCLPRPPFTCVAPIIWPCQGGFSHSLTGKFYSLRILNQLPGQLVLSAVPNVGRLQGRAQRSAIAGDQGNVWARSRSGRRPPSPLSSLYETLSLVIRIFHVPGLHRHDSSH